MKLEDLLKIKKVETPSQEEWQKFDDELRRKMFLSMVNGAPRRHISFSVFRKPAALLAVGLPFVALALFFTGEFRASPKISPESFESFSAQQLPQTANVFAVNEISTNFVESALDAPLSFSDNSLINYVAAMPAQSGIAF